MQWYKCGGSASGSAFTKVNNSRDPYVGPIISGLYGWHTIFKQTQIEMKPTMEYDYVTNTLRDIWCVVLYVNMFSGYHAATV
jgi:hypothetical protein